MCLLVHYALDPPFLITAIICVLTKLHCITVFFGHECPPSENVVLRVRNRCREPKFADAQTGEKRENFIFEKASMPIYWQLIGDKIDSTS